MSIFGRSQALKRNSFGLKVAQRPIYDDNNELVAPSRQYDVLKVGTLVLITAGLTAITNRPLLVSSLSQLDELFVDS